MTYPQFFVSGLQLLFIGLKLANLIAWSWLWVMSPLWIPLALIVVLSILVAIFE